MDRLLAVVVLAAGCGGASAKLELSNDTATPRLADPAAPSGGTMLELKIIAAYLSEDIDPVTMENVGDVEMIWLNPQCGGDISGCNIDGFTLPSGPRITDYFDLSQTDAEINAELNSQGATISAGSYRYAHLELCKALGGQATPTVPAMMWQGPDMTAPEPFTSGDCGRTSLEFDPPLTLVDGDSVEITLGYDLGSAVVAGVPTSDNPGSIVGATNADGTEHAFRACVDVDADHRDCVDYPDFAPTATKL